MRKWPALSLSKWLAGLLIIGFVVFPYPRAAFAESAVESYLSSYREAVMLVQQNAWEARGTPLSQLLTSSLDMLGAGASGPIPSFAGKDTDQINAAVRYLRPIFESLGGDANKERRTFYVLLYGLLRGIDHYAMPFPPVPLDENDPSRDVSFPKFLRDLGLTEFGDGVISFESDDHLYWVLGVVPDSPAAGFDLRYGDQILTMNGRSMEPYSEANEYLATREAIANGKTAYTFRRFDKTFTLEIPFRRRANPLVKGQLLKGAIAYIAMPPFEAGVGIETVDLLKDLIAKGAKGVILDFRSNPGGLLTDAKIVMSIFKQGNLFQFKYRGAVATERSVPTELTFEGPLAILVDRESASAPEFITYALRSRARIFSQDAYTYGKGIAQNVFGLANGWYYQFTVGQIYGFDGNSYHGQGIPPDELVQIRRNGKDEASASDDPVADRAIEWLLSQIK